MEDRYTMSLTDVRLRSGSGDELTDPGEKITVPVIAGPTAAGKTAVGVMVAEAIDGEIISADSRQIYRRMSIGTGAPSEDEQKRAVHHLVGFIEPEVRLSAGEFAKMARATVQDIISRGKVPVVVGGSGLYIRAMIDGLARIPSADPDLRRDIQERIELRGMEAMIEELRKVDPEYAEMVGLRDRKRLVRALEVRELTGRSFSEWHRGQPEQEWCLPLFFGLDRPRSELHELIVRRVDTMLNNGWIDEVHSLITHYSTGSEDGNGRINRNNLPPSITEAVGYKDIIAYLMEETDIESARERIVISTRQFAKRQLTWFRADERVLWLEGMGSEAVDKWAKIIVENVRQHRYSIAT